MNKEKKAKAEQYLSENPITFWEKISINRWTWIDCISAKINKKGKDGFNGERVSKNFWDYKIRCYRILLTHLVNEETDFSIRYIQTICGDIQVKHAIERGLLEETDYFRLIRDYLAK